MKARLVRSLGLHASVLADAARPLARDQVSAANNRGARQRPANRCSEEKLEAGPAADRGRRHGHKRWRWSVGRHRQVQDRQAITLGLLGASTARLQATEYVH